MSRCLYRKVNKCCSNNIVANLLCTCIYTRRCKTNACTLEIFILVIKSSKASGLCYNSTDSQPIQHSYRDLDTQQLNPTMCVLRSVVYTAMAPLQVVFQGADTSSLPTLTSSVYLPYHHHGPAKETEREPYGRTKASRTQC